MRHLMLISLLLAGLSTAAQPALFDDVRVFDGERLVGTRDVLVSDGKIAAIRKSIVPPEGAVVIVGQGKTLLPGLIDSHTHTWADNLVTALAFGVTTELDMFTDKNFLKQMKEEQAAGKAAGRADIVSAGTLVTAPGGHGTEYGMEIPTITRPEDAQAFVDARLAEGSDFIKIVYDDGHAYGIQFKSISRETMKAVIDAAHKRGKLAVVHVGDLASARAAIDAGADALIHLFTDNDPDAAFGRDVAKKKMFVIPTLTVLMSITGTGGGATLVDDVRIKPLLTKPEATQLAQGFPRRAGRTANSFAAAEKTIRQLLAAKVPILAGTDAGNPGTAHGSALHRELELLVNAGLTPAQALAAATSVPAKAFRLEDRGRILAGRRADLVLVNGDPTKDITATRDIAGIWKGGVAFDRPAYAARIKNANESFGAKPAGLEAGLISDFNDSTTKSQFGAGWEVSTDGIAGGKSKGTLNVEDGALVVAGEIAGPLPYAWAGAMFSPGAGVFQPADLSSKKELRFRSRGDGKTYRVMLFAASRGYMPATQTFVAAPEWTAHSFPIASFDGMDGKDVTAIIVVGGPAPGPFRFQIDDVRME
jgi:imidazolonepropionase-like amidohydrolase